MLKSAHTVKIRPDFLCGRQDPLPEIHHSNKLLWLKTKEVKLLHLEMTKVKNTKNMQTLNNERINWLGCSFI